ncbi:MAG: RNA-binding protein [Terrimonas sp.]|nr:RNA-binding protein [Terrimonas sp.]
MKHLKRKPVLAFVILFSLLFSSCQQKEKQFTSMTASETGIHFTNQLVKKHLFSILYYLYYYNGGGVAIGDINGDGLPDIYFTANSKGGNKLYLNKGGFKFEDITEKAGVQGSADWCTGATMADVNGDGLLDIYVSTVSNKYGLQGHNELFINKGNETFTEASAAYGLNTSCFTTQSVFFDYDHDGDLDCFILNQSHHPNANIVDTSHRNKYDALSGDRLYRNDVSTTGKFTDVSREAGISQSNLGYGLGISVADFNNDGWEDIYIGNDFHENDYYYINRGDGTFKDEGASHFGHYSRFSMGNDAADFNNDGMIDIMTTDMLPPDEKTMKTYGSDEHFDIYNQKITRNGYQQQVSRNCLQRNDGDGKVYSDIALMAGVSATDWSWCPLFADFDNDGNKDLFVSSGIVKRPVDLDYIVYASDLKNKGMDATDQFDDQAIEAMPDGSSHPFLFRGDGQYQFRDVSDEWGTGAFKGYYNGAAYADLDNDGDLDLVINSLNAPAVILKNNTAGKNYLTVTLNGTGLNTSGIGAKVYLFTKGGMQYQQLMLTRGFESSCENRLHFGLDSIRVIDSLLVVWPNQQYELLKDIPVNQQLAIVQKGTGQPFDIAKFFPPQNSPLVDITREKGIDWSHHENNFVDFNFQYLIPHEESTRGPRIAVGDVNADGLDDFYTCGAKGQPGSLMIQQKDGHFQPADTALFNRFAVCEDVDALFFDANGDGNLDLWVVSGGNEMPVNDIASADRLFINDGKGNFSITLSAIPQLYENKSCVTVADIDKDGDSDVFVGFLSDPRKYGIPQSSYLYLNDGKGKFTIAPKATMNLLNIGLVTAAAFNDLNNDGWPDLVVTGEWMPLKIFMNNKGGFTETDLPHSSGLWQTIYMADVNGDGKQDILAGNWGHNSKLWAGKDGPLKLYVKDFDNNGSFEQVMCYTLKGKQYTFLAKDELEKALPVLKKAYLSYQEVAGKDVKYIFYDLFKDYTELTAETLSSSCFINDGKGGFRRLDLPDELQLSPLMAFTRDAYKGAGSFIAGGNFFGVLPYEGRYDALLPTGFSYDKQTNSFTHIHSLADIHGEIRDFKWVRQPDNKNMLVLARNNEQLILLTDKN